MTTTSAADAPPSARPISSAVSTSTREATPSGVGSATGPAISVTRAPRAAAAAAMANPIFPDERLPTKRTSSIGSCVGPAVTTTCRPARSRVRASCCSTANRISAGSMRRPCPTQPHASGPRSGPTVVKRPAPSVTSRRARFDWVIGFCHMLTFIAGASSTGARDASTTAARRSLAMPAARRAIASAVAGATTIRSASSARRMCPICDSSVRSKSSRPTGWPDNVCMVRGVMNCVAASVRITRTSAPALMKRRQSSAALYAAMPPVTPSTRRRPCRLPRPASDAASKVPWTAPAAPPAGRPFSPGLIPESRPYPKNG